MLSRKIVTGEREMLVQVYVKRGCLVPMHAHESEQMTYVLQGALRFLVGGEEITVREGEVLHIPSGVEHQAEALEDTFELDVFSPIRQDWLDHTDDYFRAHRTTHAWSASCFSSSSSAWSLSGPSRSYNRLVGLQNQVLNGWRQIDVQLKRRHDLIPNLVNAVTGSMDFERDTLTAVMEARVEGADRDRPGRCGAEGRAAHAGARAAAGASPRTIRRSSRTRT